MSDEFDDDFTMPDGEDSINPDALPEDFDTDLLPDGWENWTWDDFWLWWDDFYTSGEFDEYYDDIPDIEGGSPTGALNG